jgi:hypothetical protein
MPMGPTTRAPANMSCVGDGSPVLRDTGIGRGEARASQVTGPSSSYVPWSNTPPDTIPSSPTHAGVAVAFEVIQHSRHPGRLEVSGPHTPWPARSHVYASPRPFLTPSQGLLPARAGSPLAGQDSHLLDDTQSFMESSHPPIPFDQHCLVALNFLSATAFSTARVASAPLPPTRRRLPAARQRPPRAPDREAPPARQRPAAAALRSRRSCGLGGTDSNALRLLKRR